MARRSPAARLRDAAPLFAALGDPTRLALVMRLSARGPDSITGLSRDAGVSRQAVTKPLGVLSAAKLVRSFRRGREHIWELEPDRIADARRYLDRIEAQWDDALERLRALVEEE